MTKTLKSKLKTIAEKLLSKTDFSDSCNGDADDAYNYTKYCSNCENYCFTIGCLSGDIINSNNNKARTNN